MRDIGWSMEGLPDGVQEIPGPRLQRQVGRRTGRQPAVLWCMLVRRNGPQAGSG